MLLFTICIILGIISLILSLFVHVAFDFTGKYQHPHQHNKGFSLQRFIAREAIPVAIIMLLVGLGYASILTFYSFAEQRHLIEASSYFFICYAIASLITRPIAGRLMDEHNENIVVYPAFIALIISFVLLVFSFNPFTLLLAGITLGIGYGNLSSSMQAIAIKVSPPAKYGLATSTYFIGLDIGIGFGPSVLGMFTNTISYSNIYLLMALVSTITIVIYFVIHGRKVKHLTPN